MGWVFNIIVTVIFAMSWLNALNTGANLYQAGQLSSLASTQNQMLNFQINQTVIENIRAIELVETRRLVVQLTGILEDAMEYIQTHPSYSSLVIPICSEFAANLNIDEGNFDEASDMVLARTLKRTLRQSKNNLTSIWTDAIARESKLIGDSLSQGQNVVNFSLSWIPDEGELINELYDVIKKFQRNLVASNFTVTHLENKGRQSWFRVDWGDLAFKIRHGPGGWLNKTPRIFNEEGDIISSNENLQAQRSSGSFVLSNGLEIQYELKIGPYFGFKSGIFTNHRLDSVTVKQN